MSTSIITKHGITGKWWVILPDGGAAQPLGPFDTKVEAENAAESLSSATPEICAHGLPGCAICHRHAPVALVEVKGFYCSGNEAGVRDICTIQCKGCADTQRDKGKANNHAAEPVPVEWEDTPEHKAILLTERASAGCICGWGSTGTPQRWHQAHEHVRQATCEHKFITSKPPMPRPRYCGSCGVAEPKPTHKRRHSIEDVSRVLTTEIADSPIPPEPMQILTDVFEVYGKTAQANGFDFIVCTTLKEALYVIESDLDELDADPDEEDEVRIVFRRYTAAQVEDVIYE